MSRRCVSRSQLAAAPVGWLALIGILAVALGYHFQPVMVIRPGWGLLGALTTQNFHDSEGSFRWTRNRSAVTFPDPGPGLDVRVEALVSGFRPPGQAAPWMVMRAGGRPLRTQAPRRAGTFVVPATTGGWWSSDLEVQFRSETFTPGPMDRRALGVRVHEVRLVPEKRPFALRRPPLKQLAATGLAIPFLFVLLWRWGVPRRPAFLVGVFLAASSGVGYAFARPHTAFLAPPLFLVSAGALALDLSLPSFLRGVGEVLSASFRFVRRGVRATQRWSTIGLVLATCGGVAVALWAHPSLDIDLGSGRETTLATGFAGLDRDGDVTFRRALRGASVDLSDFGGAAKWKIDVTASLSDGTERIVLARVGRRELVADVDGDWSTHSFEIHPSHAWRSDIVIDFPAGSHRRSLRIDRLQIERRGSFPSWRILFVTALLVLLVIAIGGASGLPQRWCHFIALVVMVGTVIALWRDPLLVVPYTATLAGIALLGWLWAAWVSGFLEQMVSPRLGYTLPSGAVVAAAIGFFGWLAVSLFPLYQGGHFVFHSSIAQDIWQGEFFTYYFPYPGSMLSRQAQWGNVVVPHSCLYHTVVSPLSALPRAQFYAAEKIFLAGMLSTMAVASALLASRLGGRTAGAFAGIAASSLPTTFQLLGLGHLMTLFGCWAATLALTFITLRFDDMIRRSTWLWATGLLALCFLSYTASLLFTAVVLMLAVPWLSRRSPSPARALATAGLWAAGIAFLLYYVHWAVPFVRDSVPALWSGAGSDEGGVLWNRLISQPRKLNYTFGHFLVPFIGIAGLRRQGDPVARSLLSSWAGVLLVFMGLDLFFNFILKHHYFVIAPVSTGLGLAAAWAWERGGGLRVIGVSFLVFLLLTGLRQALAVALGSV